MEDQTPTVNTITERAAALTAMIDEESDQLTRERPHNLMELVTRKEALANAFNHSVRQLLMNRNRIAEATIEERQALKVALQAFDASVMRNGALLLKLKRHSEQMLETIASEMHPGRRKVASYGPAAMAQANATRAPLAINAVI